MRTVGDRDVRSWLFNRKQKLKTAIADYKEAAHFVRLLQEVDSALERIDNESYGLCEVCHEPIEEELLTSDPLIRLCLDHLTPDQQRALEQDLDLASRIQTQLLPKHTLKLNDWEIYYHYEGAGPVSGDYCDIVSPELKDRDIFFILGDVSGKGVAASLLMSNLHAIFHSLVAIVPHLSQLVERANHIFYGSTMSSSYATLVCGKVSQTGEVDICNAGHCPPLLIEKGVVSKLEATGLPVGLFSKGEYSVKNLKLSFGDSILLYTDGLTEALDRVNAEYGEDRLVKLVKKHHHLSPQALTEVCLDDLKAFLFGESKKDDLSIMVIQRVK